jgi:hypothetical protein
METITQMVILTVKIHNFNYHNIFFTVAKKFLYRRPQKIINIKMKLMKNEGRWRVACVSEGKTNKMREKTEKEEGEEEGRENLK